MSGAFQVGAYQPNYQQEATAVVTGGIPTGGGGGSLWYKRRKRDRELDNLLDDVAAEVMYRDLIETPLAKEAAQIVKPFSEVKKAAVPAAATIDWEGLEADIVKLAKLTDLWQKYNARIAILRDEEHWLMFDN